MKKGTCKHYNGSYHNKVCDAGVCYRDVTTDPDVLDGSALRIPCRIVPFDSFTPSQMAEFNRRGKCDKYEDPSDEEIAQDEKEMEAMTERFKLSLPVITKVKLEHKDTNWKGVETCPVCGGRLHMTHAACNGHVWGKCETDGCLAWME